MICDEWENYCQEKYGASNIPTAQFFIGEAFKFFDYEIEEYYQDKVKNRFLYPESNVETIYPSVGNKPTDENSKKMELTRAKLINRIQSFKKQSGVSIIMYYGDGYDPKTNIMYDSYRLYTYYCTIQDITPTVRQLPKGNEEFAKEIGLDTTHLEKMVLIRDFQPELFVLDKDSNTMKLLTTIEHNQFPDFDPFDIKILDGLRRDKDKTLLQVHIPTGGLDDQLEIRLFRMAQHRLKVNFFV